MQARLAGHFFLEAAGNVRSVRLRLPIVSSTQSDDIDGRMGDQGLSIELSM